MKSVLPPLSVLFAQLGLAEDDAAIRAFVERHSPLAAGVRLAEAPFWTPSQAGLLAEQLAQDADWSAVVDPLNLALHRLD